MKLENTNLSELIYTSKSQGRMAVTCCRAGEMERCWSKGIKDIRRVSSGDLMYSLGTTVNNVV